MPGHNIFFLILILYLSLDYAQPKRVPVAGEHDWDLLIFTQHWPATVCKEWKHNPSHQCSMPSMPDSWSIHGIWPTKIGTIGPEYCNRTWHFDPEAIRPIEDSLIEQWTNIEGNTSLYSLWAHEWTKHGTCAAVLEPLNSELKYFSKGLELLQKFSMTNILEEANIVPGNDKEYTIGDIHNAIRVRLGVNPDIECRKEEGGKNWLFELRICFNKSLQLMNCDGIRKPKVIETQDGEVSVVTNCDTSQSIFYPTSGNLQPPPKLIYVQLYKLSSWLQWFTL